MSNSHGILSFPRLFTPAAAKGSDKKKFNCSILIPPNDPQVAVIQAEVDAAKQNTFPSGYTSSDECFGLYDTRMQGKDYYDPRFAGWYILSSNASETDKPGVADANHRPIVDPGAVVSGMMGWLVTNIVGYTAGRGLTNSAGGPSVFSVRVRHNIKLYRKS